MRGLNTFRHIHTQRHIRTRHSIPNNTGPGRARWPRLKEAEQLSLQEQWLQNRRRSSRK